MRLETGQVLCAHYISKATTVVLTHRLQDNMRMIYVMRCISMVWGLTNVHCEHLSDSLLKHKTSECSGRST
jgi:hypothetical protein